MEGDLKKKKRKKKITIHKDSQSITKVHQNDLCERLWNDKLEQHSNGRQRLSQCRSGEEM